MADSSEEIIKHGSRDGDFDAHEDLLAGGPGDAVGVERGDGSVWQGEPSSGCERGGVLADVGKA